MSQKFRARIRQSIADSNLQIALDNNAQRRTAGRLAAWATLPDHQERRQRLHAVKADVVANLDAYLAQFIANLEKNGILVHRAANAEEAIRIFLEIAGTQKTKNKHLRSSASSADNILVAKAKSMVSEELNFNHALEAAGIRVVETDLGEYIVQLRGEHPSHIITPAVHLRREQVGQLFHEKLGIPYTDDIPTLTQTARSVLREVFLTADIGVSGVNVGVAETGTLSIVTNEGNGRMCTTLPPVHVALMGIERLVPTMDDLALVLSLLPRSATGQKLSVYTSLINRPLPGQTRHIILVDNGRSALRTSPLSDILLCIRCGACLNACPVYRNIGGHAYGSVYPGPIGSLVTPLLEGVERHADLARASSLCGACGEACPVRIDIPRFLVQLRADTRDAQPLAKRAGVTAWALAVASRGSFEFAQRLLRLAARRATGRPSAWLGPLVEWTRVRDLPTVPPRGFREIWTDGLADE